MIRHRVVRVVVSLAVVIGASVSAPTADAEADHSTTIVNGNSAGATIRFDTQGNAIDAHDGEIQRFGDT